MEDLMKIMENEDIDQVIDDILDSEILTEASKTSNAKVISQGVKDAANITGKAFRAAQTVATSPFKLISLIKKLVVWMIDAGKNIKIDIRTRIYNKEGKVDEAKLRASWNRYVENTKEPGFLTIIRDIQTIPVPNSADVVAMGKSVKAYKQALDVLVDTAVKYPETTPKEVPKFMPESIFEPTKQAKAIAEWTQNYTAYKDTLLSIISCVNIFDDISKSIEAATQKIDAAYSPSKKNESIIVKGYGTLFTEADDSASNQAAPQPQQNNTAQQNSNTQPNPQPKPQEKPQQPEEQQKQSAPAKDDTKDNPQQKKTYNISKTLSYMHSEATRIYQLASPLMDVYWILTKYTSIRDVNAFNEKVARLQKTEKK